jgi:hypothetical protein
MLAEWSMLTYWRGLSSGDPVAWGITIGLPAILLAAIAWDYWRKAKTPDDHSTL